MYFLRAAPTIENAAASLCKQYACLSTPSFLDFKTLYNTFLLSCVNTTRVRSTYPIEFSLTFVPTGGRIEEEYCPTNLSNYSDRPAETSYRNTRSLSGMGHRHIFDIDVPKNFAPNLDINVPYYVPYILVKFSVLEYMVPSS